MDFLIVVDMQNDFVDGVLGTKEAEAIVPAVAETIRNWNGPVICTRELNPVIAEAADVPDTVMELNKPSFGSLELPKCIQLLEDDEDPISSITLVGLCTDICVISNAMILKAAFPETPIRVLEKCCAGVTPEQHRNALNAMKVCQIEVE